MGHMVNGIYHVEDPITPANPSGDWERAKSVIRHWITPDGSPGPTGKGGFTAEAGRYHLFVAWNCPWAHRTLLTRAVKGLQGVISVSYAKPNRTDQGWVFDDDGPFSDPLLGVSAVHEIYGRDATPYTGRLTVPVLWDKTQKRIVNIESADIVRMLNAAFVDVVPPTTDLYPIDRREEIDQWNELIYTTLNNGVYRAGFASAQDAYERAARDVFLTLNKIEMQLSKTRYLTGSALTEADIRLFPTLARFDVAYHYAFKCNLYKILDYNMLWKYSRDIYQLSNLADTVNFDIYKQGYFSVSENRNPLGIVPIGPLTDWNEPHGRG